MQPLSLVAALGACYCSYRAFSLPSHPYQVTLGVCLVLLAYHRGWLLWTVSIKDSLLAVANLFSVSCLIKLFLGGGVRSPFFWVKYPWIHREGKGGKFLDWVPNLALNWEMTSLSEWMIDVTALQTYLLLITGVTAIIHFQPFASYAAFLLLLVSLPSFLTYDWAWVFPSLLLTVISWYAQRNTWSSKFASVPRN